MDIFKCGNVVITDSVIQEAVESVGVTKGDVVYVHSSLLKFGRPLLDRERTLNIIVSILQYIVGSEGTIIMPTYSYSACRGEIYDRTKTKSRVGLLTEHFRNMDGVKRTMHPIFSDAVWGAKQEYFLDCELDAFGKGSVFSKLVERKAKLLTFGETKGYTFFHYCEEQVGVPYRFFKMFPAEISVDGEVKKFEIPYYVRMLDRRSLCNDQKLHLYLSKLGIEKNICLENAIISCADVEQMYEAVVAKLEDEPEFFLRV